VPRSVLDHHRRDVTRHPAGPSSHARLPCRPSSPHVTDTRAFDVCKPKGLTFPWAGRCTIVGMETTTRTSTSRPTGAGAIGPMGIGARIAVGFVFIAAALWWRDPTWVDVIVGLVVLPAAAIGLLGWRARVRPDRLEALSPTAHCLNVMLFLPLFFIPATAGGAFFFYGMSMFIAALRRTGGCEVTAVANAVLGREDQVGCVLFSPIDTAEAARREAAHR
jgi:hypothetical protein